MRRRIRQFAERCYERLLLAELSETPSHVAVIQDGNRRYAERQGAEATDGHRAGAETTEQLLRWCDELDIDELTLYAFSTENFERPAAEREALFDLVTRKLREFADNERVHEAGMRIHAIGETGRLPERVQDAIAYAQQRTAEHDTYQLNIALAYGGRAELLGATRKIARAVERGELDPAEVDTDTVETALYDGPSRDVDLIVRSGGDERTSNFLPWQANGNEAAVYFSAPYWPAFRKIDLLRGIRTVEHREQTRRWSRLQRVHTFAGVALDIAADSPALGRLRQALPGVTDQPTDRASEEGDTDPAD
ncbi:MAG: undecaprenyl pyrophosphate synthetase [halophilic archaeon J07HX64]|jgi:Undecaprenyl pyrophosphate synthetase (EC 2.5.1.31)|nr:MAG: undecaprenyl pyrophosphate synthetase [halophilic archaeon J07HX64]